LFPKSIQIFKNLKLQKKKIKKDEIIIIMNQSTIFDGRELLNAEPYQSE